MNIDSNEFYVFTGDHLGDKIDICIVDIKAAFPRWDKIAGGFKDPVINLMTKPGKICFVGIRSFW